MIPYTYLNRNGNSMKNGLGRGEMIDYWYLSEGWMLVRRVSPLGELAKPHQLGNSSCFVSQMSGRLNNEQKMVKLPCFFEPSGTCRWHDVRSVCNEAAEKTQKEGASP